MCGYSLLTQSVFWRNKFTGLPVRVTNGGGRRYLPMVAATLCWIVATFSAAPKLKLEKLILYSRHGIRVPYGLPGGADLYSKSPRNFYTDFADWGAEGPAYLTPHGEQVITRMGEYYRTRLVETGLLPATGENLTVYADAAPTGRDVKTAAAFFRGVLPGVEVAIQSDPAIVELMFNQGQLPGGNNTACSGPTKLQVDGTIGGGAEALNAANEESILGLSKVLDCCQPAACMPTAPFPSMTTPNASMLSALSSARTASARAESARTTPASGCDLMGLPTEWLGKFYEYYSGPFFTSASIAEYLQLIYLNNLSWSAGPAPSLSEAALSAAVDLHQAGLDVTEDYVATRDYGSDMLATLLATVLQLTAGGQPRGLASAPTDRVVYFAGHDINLYFARNFLRLSWLTESWNANQAMPGGMLEIEILTAEHQDASARDRDDAAEYDDEATGVATATASDPNATLGVDATSGGATQSAASRFFLKVFFSSQTYSQMRHAEDLLPPAKPPSRVYVTIPECSDGPEGSCPLEGFRALVLRSIRKECVSTVDVTAL